MSECIKFRDSKIKAVQKEDKWFVSVRHIGIALGMSFERYNMSSFASAI